MLNPVIIASIFESFLQSIFCLIYKLLSCLYSYMSKRQPGVVVFTIYIFIYHLYDQQNASLIALLLVRCTVHLYKNDISASIFFYL